MVQFVLNVEDSAVNDFKAFLNLCPSIEIVNEFSDIEVRKELDVCIEESIRELRKNNVFRKPSDYTYIMQVINDKKVVGAPYFMTPDLFLSYLANLGLDNLPGRSTIYDTRKIMSGEYPHWIFNDPKIDNIETLRRNNVARQFLSALYNAQRTLSDGFSDKVRICRTDFRTK
jgi:hypothetical protein